jgi:hypothetical protein
MKAHNTMLLKSRASTDILPFRICNKKRLANGHKKNCSEDSIESVLHDREVFQAKYLSFLLVRENRVDIFK